MSADRMGRELTHFAISALPETGRRILAWSIAFTLAAALGIELTRFSGNVASLWPANGVLCAALLSLDRQRDRAWVLALSVIGDIGVNLFFDHTPLVAILIAPINVAEATLAYVLTRKFCRAPFNFESTPTLLTFAATGGLLAPIVPSIAAATLLHNAYGDPFLTVLRVWFASDALGLLMIVPTVMLLLASRHTMSTVDRVEIACCLGILLVVTIFTFAQSTLPLLFLPIPFLMLAAFRLTPAYAAFATLIMSAIALVFTASASGPTALMMGTSVGDRVQFVQLWVTVVFFFVMPAANSIAEQTRLRDALVRRESETREAKEHAERAAAAKSDFLATMSHEIRTPLNTILGHAQLALQRPLLKDDAARDITIVRDAGRTLLSLVNDILDYSSIEAGQIRLSPTDVRLGKIAEDCLALQRATAEEKGLALSCHVSPDIAGLVVRADAQRLGQILLNLVNNAIKYTDTGSVAVSLAATACEDDQIAVRFAIADTGSGIPPDAQGTLFERFTQLDSGRQRRHGGTGLGLAICKSLVTAMQGRIGVDSTLGKGSTFWFEVPLNAAIPAELLNAAEMQTVKPNRFKSLKVLVVDDLDLNRELTSEILRSAGHQAALASSGAAAIRMVLCETFDAVLMDVQMPGMDGHAATREIRSLGLHFATLPIIAMTANVLPDDIDLCLAAGMTAHIGKPFDWNDLLGLLQRHCAAHLEGGEGVQA